MTNFRDWTPAMVDAFNRKTRIDPPKDVNKISITIPGTVRIKKNSRRIFGGGSLKTNLPSEAYCEWEAFARSIAWQHAVSPPLECPVHIEARFFIKGQLPDLSGALESVGDMLEGVLYRNDKQIYSWDGSRVSHDPKNPRTEIIVRW
jgi:hypothetical protein